jgi:hypothetical protein
MMADNDSEDSKEEHAKNEMFKSNPSAFKNKNQVRSPHYQYKIIIYIFTVFIC